MLDVYLCCAPADVGVAEQIAERLRRGAEMAVSIDDRAGETVASRWDCGLSSAGILLLLSPEAAPRSAARSDWGALLDHVAGNAEPPVGSILLRDCAYPRILERRNFFRWDGSVAAVRAVERWAIRLHGLPRERSFAPARLPWFEGREPELELLWDTLVDAPGTAVVVNPEPGTGKTVLAHEFARQAGSHFRDVIWIGCGGRSVASVAADLGDRLDFEPLGDGAAAVEHAVRRADRHRMLIVLDDVDPSFPLPPGPRERASLIVTARSFDSAAAAAAVLPIVGAARPNLAASPSGADLALWRAMAVCHRDGFPIDLAAAIAGIDPAEVGLACGRLIRARLVDPWDEEGSRFRLGARIATAAGDLDDARRRHAQILRDRLRRPGRLDDSLIPELMPAFLHAANDDWELARNIAKSGFAALCERGRTAEAMEMLVALRDTADARGDWETSDECAWELSWVRGVPYRGEPRRSGGDQLSFEFAGV